LSFCLRSFLLPAAAADEDEERKRGLYGGGEGEREISSPARPPFFLRLFSRIFLFLFRFLLIFFA